MSTTVPCMTLADVDENRVCRVLLNKTKRQARVESEKKEENWRKKFRAISNWRRLKKLRENWRKKFEEERSKKIGERNLRSFPQERKRKSHEKERKIVPKAIVPEPPD